LRVAPDTKAFLREESSIEASERTADTEAFGLVSAATRFSVSEESGGLASSLASKDSPNQPMDSMQAIKKISWLLGTRSTKGSITKIAMGFKRRPAKGASPGLARLWQLAFCQPCVTCVYQPCPLAKAATAALACSEVAEVAPVMPDQQTNQI
jgi:hypothetical protein